MPARSAARSPSPTSRPSFINRLKKPFGPKARLYSDFYIQPDDPHRVYGPGDVITGSVVLKVTKPFSVTHIVVCLHGYSQVYKTPNSPGESYRHYNTILASGKSRKSGGYYGNGFIALFEDEVVLCGDGRLGEGTYQFNFELIFPREHLPSSIEFERGTVSYMITATLTRPTTLSPTSTCHRNVSFQEDIDVAPLSQPKPRIITLEPITKRIRPKPKLRRQSSLENAASPAITAAEQSSASSNMGSEDTATEADGREQAVERSVEAISPPFRDPPRSPVASDISFDSRLSNGGGTSSAIDSAASSGRVCDGKHTSKSQACSKCQKHPITATISIEKAGFLRGDVVPIKVWLIHTRAIKSLRGVIVTLYRQARVDSQPALPMIRGGDDEGNSRVKTGIANLSISSASSTHTYRKDLDQQFGSLIVNPTTMQAEVKVTLRVPDEAFPSIASVPGSMISFKYYVEVVVDIQGKLASLDKYLPTMNTAQGGLSGGRSGDANGSNYAPWGGHFINTEEIKRERSVIYSIFEVVVGTRDSERRSPWKQPQTNDSSITDPELGVENVMEDTDNMRASGDALESPDPIGENRPLSWDQYWRHHPSDHSGLDHNLPPPPPTLDYPPPADDEHNLTEKERLQRAEARLLPSAPPDIGVSSAFANSEDAPSAPHLDENGHDVLPIMAGPSSAALDIGEFSRHRARFSSMSNASAASASSAMAHNANTNTAVRIADNKEEMLRIRLQAERSAPAPPVEHLQMVRAASDRPLPSLPIASVQQSLEDRPDNTLRLGEQEDFGFSAPVPRYPLPRYEQ